MFKTPLTGFFVEENPRGEKAYVPRIGTPYDNMHNLSTHLDWLVKLADLLPALISVPMHLVGTGLILGRINDNICYVPKLIKDLTDTCVPTYTIEGLPDGWNFNTTNGVITRSLVDQDLRDYGNIVIIAHCGSTTVQHFVNVKILPELITAPIITVLGSNPLTSVLNTSYTDPGATALDISDGDISSQIQVQGVVDTANAGTYNIIYSVTNSLGETSTATRVVVVAGDNPPVITLIGDDMITIPVDSGFAPTISLNGASPITLTVGDTLTDPGATATDNEDGDISSQINITGSVNTNVSGIYPVIYSITDSDGNNVNVVREFVVLEDSNSDNVPVITLIGLASVYINVGDTYVEPGYTATDVEDGDLTSLVTVSFFDTTNGGNVVSSIDTSTVGQYLISYNVEDSDGNPHGIDRTVNVVVPNPAPVITLIGPASIDVNIGDTFVDPGYIATDAEDGDLTAEVSVSFFETTNGGNVVFDIDTSTAGEYLISYYVEDSDGNTHSLNRAVNVVAP